MMQQKLPTLYHQSKRGDIREWNVWTEGAVIVTEHGVKGGKLQLSRKTAIGKNLGSSNETTPDEQATLEAKSLWQYKLDRKYSETLHDAKEQLFLPMLAHTFEGTKKKKFTYPADLQPKLDGVRCLATKIHGKVQLTSRQGKPWSIPHIERELDWIPEDTIFDGEIYIHGESCQRITSLVRSAVEGERAYKPESLGLSYYIYDIPKMQGDDKLTWQERHRDLCEFHRNYRCKHVHFVGSQSVANEKEAETETLRYMKQGYEGSILRGRDGLYLWGYRSADLLKIKIFQDAEFEVVEVHDGKGKMEGCAIFTCQNDMSTKTFDCVMKVPLKIRREMYLEKQKYIGKKLTVKFFERTDDQIPRFPVGIVFRDDADLPTKGA